MYFNVQKVVNFCVAAAGSLVLLSCSSDELMDTSDSSLRSSKISFLNIEGIPVELDGQMLAFDSMEQLEQAVNNLKQKEYIQDDLNKALLAADENTSININGFTSIYDSYDNALSESDAYYDTNKHYQAFKQKYANLYFPEHGDDYSVYLPVKDKYVAKLLDLDGNVKIAGKVVNMKDITTYEQLVEAGQTMEDASNLMTRANFQGNYVNGTPELKRADGNRKLKVRVYTQPGSSGVMEEIVIDVMFRKKGAMGIWYNYKSETELRYMDGKPAKPKKHGFSSHDYKWPRKFANGKPVPFINSFQLYYQGFGTDLVIFKVNI